MSHNPPEAPLPGRVCGYERRQPPNRIGYRHRVGQARADVAVTYLAFEPKDPDPTRPNLYRKQRLQKRDRNCCRTLDGGLS